MVNILFSYVIQNNCFKIYLQFKLPVVYVSCVYFDVHVIFFNMKLLWCLLVKDILSPVSDNWKKKN